MNRPFSQEEMALRQAKRQLISTLSHLLGDRPSKYTATNPEGDEIYIRGYATGILRLKGNLILKILLTHQSQVISGVSTIAPEYLYEIRYREAEVKRFVPNERKTKKLYNGTATAQELAALNKYIRTWQELKPQLR